MRVRLLLWVLCVWSSSLWAKESAVWVERPDFGAIGSLIELIALLDGFKKTPTVGLASGRLGQPRPHHHGGLVRVSIVNAIAKVR